MIYETVIYDGALKNYRVLNLNTGTFYSMSFDSFEIANQAIKNGETRAGQTVKRTELREILQALNVPVADDTGLNGRYVVVREPRATARRPALKELSRPFKSYQDANDWMEGRQTDESNRRYCVYIVRIMNADEEYEKFKKNGYKNMTHKQYIDGIHAQIAAQLGEKAKKVRKLS